MRIYENWRNILKKAWSVRVGAFFSLLGAFLVAAGLTSEWAQTVIPSWLFGLIILVAGFSFNVARFLKQPGTDI